VGNRTKNARIMTEPLVVSGSLDVAEQDNLDELRRFAEIGRLSASMLHEISNPLTAALLHLEHFDAIETRNIDSARRSIRLLQRYVEAARQQIRSQSQVTRFYTSSQIEQVKRVLMPVGRQAGVKLVFDCQANCRLLGDPVKFQQLLANIITNAIQAYAGFQQGPQEVLISVRASTRHVFITVRDWGLGMSEEELQYIFEPFYTTKVGSGYGLGIGLSIVRESVETGFGGRIYVRSKIGKGTAFTIRLPICRSSHSKKPAQNTT